ncbi:hypothetical protein AAFF_G00161540 [Aldrovandia affinis]|uniref:Uncharacterized protein n=1 Tax=Aldrovandia affinis TaxID=143900 RepID=A0AAD7RN27_9TELE|nr:hypothetical protein AAFF_G00161540 [Aldrovandia affinis]
MDEPLGGRPSIQPPVLVASAWGGHSPAAAVAEPAAGPERQELGPGPSKRRRETPVLQFLKMEAEKAEERDRRDEQREERLLSLLEKIVDKM